ncbi:MAG: class I SAM-dependent methyltransferase [Candidatus Nomurabacteria bacterium]|jgi:hypothetical protein|nr:class I SAM-dependent methyltransferase [Candidatus Nomurabacteria bacterium]
MSDNNFDEIIPTAIQGAYYKTLTDIPYSTEILKEARDLCGELPQDIIVDEKAVIREARHKIIDKLLKQSGITQVFELAAGYSSRGLKFTENENCCYVELDLSTVSKAKEMIIERVVGERKNLHVINGNALDEQVYILAQAYFDKSLPATIVNEGLLRYLSFDEKSELAENIRRFITQYGGVWITGDGGFMDFRKNQNQILPEHDKSLSKRVPRNSFDNVFENKEDFANFFARFGFSTEFYRYSDVLGELSSAKVLGLSNGRVHDLLFGAYAAVLKLR